MQGTPIGIKILAPLCLILILLVPVFRKHAAPEVPLPAETATASFTPELDIPQAALDPATRRIKGVIRNHSSRDYRDVQVTYKIFGTSGSVVGIVDAKVQGLVGNQSAHLLTTALPADGREYELREVLGSRRWFCRHISVQVGQY